LRQLFAANRRLFKAYVLREQLDRLWTYTTRNGVARFLYGWLKALCWQQLPEMEKFGDTLVNTSMASPPIAIIRSASVWSSR
jgi:hypothetical protein